MRITFSTEEAARAALGIWERHGFSATRSGAVVATDCPALWAIPVIHRTIGFHQVEELVVVADSSTATKRSPELPLASPEQGIHEARRARAAGSE